MGNVVTVALIDKSSVVIAILLAWWLLSGDHLANGYRRNADCSWVVGNY